jgi:integrase
MPLTVKGVEAKSEPGMYGDGGGLYLRVGPTGAKSWIVRTVIHGKRRELGIGSAGLVSLADARKKATALREVARAGGDPDADRKAAAKAAAEAARRDLITFGKAAEAAHAKLLPKWKNQKHAETWLSGLKLHAFPRLGEKPIQSITREDVLRVLEPIWTNRVETARRLRQRIHTVFQWAKDEGHFTGENPVGQIGLGLTQVNKNTTHLAAMPWRDVPAFWMQLADREGVSSACLRFAILTAARSGEARGATWAEIDLEGAAWNVPGERMKRGVPHRVPLSAEALALLATMRGLDPVLCFPSPNRGKEGVRPLSDMAFKLLYNRMGVSGFTTHGFRSAFRDWCSESAKADPELAEAALSHATGNAVVRAYARSDLFDRRRDLMQAWSRFAIGQTAGEVVQLVRA